MHAFLDCAYTATTTTECKSEPSPVSGGCPNPPNPLRRGPTEDPVFNGLLSATTRPRPTLSTPRNSVGPYPGNGHGGR